MSYNPFSCSSKLRMVSRVTAIRLNTNIIFCHHALQGHYPKKSRGSFSLSRLESILLGTHKNHLFFGSLTGAVIGTRWWVGRDNAILAEPTPSHENCLKT